MTNRRPILKKNVEAFVPSPRFLSDSPARQPSSSDSKPTPVHISHPGQPLPSHASSQPPAPQLRSPIPPPPANLYGENASAFNVDPGIPFLGAVGGIEAGNLDKRPINGNESPNRVGGIVSGLKKALTIKDSRRDSSGYPQAGEDIYSRPILVRDSGYAASNSIQQPLLPANQPPHFTTFSPPPPLSQDSLPVTSQPPPNDYQAMVNNYQNSSPDAALHDPPSLDSMVSAYTAHVGYAPGYARMDRPTPPQSDVSFNTYITRIKDFVHDIIALPWIANDRVTVDYYPSGTQRHEKRLPHRPAIVWRSKDYNLTDYHLDSDTSESLTLRMTPHVHVRPPSRTSRAEFNLESEFSERTNSLVSHPPSAVQTPTRRHAQSEGVESPSRNASKTPLPPSSVQKRWEDPFPNTSQTFVPYWGPTQLLDPVPPNSGQTPNLSRTYPEESHQESRNANPALPKTPSVRRSQTGDTEPLLVPPNTGRTRRTHDEDLRLVSRSDANPAFSNTSPTRHHPSSVRSTANTRGDPFVTTPTSGQRPEYSLSPILIPARPPSNRAPRPRSSQQPTQGSPSRRSHKSNTRRSRHESTEEWDGYPEDRPGYVPFERSENYYGTQYGVGIHGLLPPVPRVSSAVSSAPPSIKQPRPQYPRPLALVTSSSSSRTNSST